MNIPTNHNIIKKDGKPLFVIIPYDEYRRYIRKQKKSAEKVYFPQKVVELHALEGKSLIRAWREYKKLSQKEIAERLEVSQAAFSQLEKPGARLRRSTLEKIAAVLEVDMSQLSD